MRSLKKFLVGFRLEFLLESDFWWNFTKDFWIKQKELHKEYQKTVEDKLQKKWAILERSAAEIAEETSGKIPAMIPEKIPEESSVLSSGDPVGAPPVASSIPPDFWDSSTRFFWGFSKPFCAIPSRVSSWSSSSDSGILEFHWNPQKVTPRIL